MGERVNGIHEVRGSIPLASMRVQGAGRRAHVIEELFFEGSAAKVLGRAGIAQLVEHNLAKVGVAGSSPVSRSQ